jgi:hypothetical protein
MHTAKAHAVLAMTALDADDAARRGPGRNANVTLHARDPLLIFCAGKGD